MIDNLKVPYHDKWLIKYEMVLLMNETKEQETWNSGLYRWKY